MNWIKEEENFVFQTYRRQPLVLVRGKGSYVWDESGKRYLDFFSGLGVNALGHCHPKIVKAISSQAARLMHTSNLYYTSPMIECARELIRRTFPGKVFFSNSGAEANECSLKLSRRWGKLRSENCYEIIAFENSFHGRTLGTLTLTGQEKFRKGFSPLLPRVLYAKFNDMGSVKKLVSKRTAAIFVEPVQGEGGVRPAEVSFLKSLHALCSAQKILLVFDEVQCGMGRSGHLFCWEHYGVKPDVLVAAKALGGGLPIGATIAIPKVAALLERGDHASTFGANPVVCSAALAVLNLLDEKFLKSARAKGALLKEKLEQLKSKFPLIISQVRGLGLMWGVELYCPGDGVVEACRKKGLLINCTQGNVLRLLPPLNSSAEEVNSAIGIISSVLAQQSAGNGKGK